MKINKIYREKCGCTYKLIECFGFPAGIKEEVKACKKHDYSKGVPKK